MSVTVTFTFTNHNPATIWNRLAVRLGRQPTHDKAKAEVRRILSEGMVDLAGKGELRWQKRDVR